MGAMFSDGHRPRLGKIEHLADGKVSGVSHVQRPAAPGTNLGEMADGGVGVLDLAQGPAGVALLPAGLLARRFTQALRAWRLLQSAAGWRFAAVGAVFAKLALQFRDARCLRGGQFLQCLDLDLERPDNLHRRRKGAAGYVIWGAGAAIRWR